MLEARVRRWGRQALRWGLVIAMVLLFTQILEYAGQGAVPV